MTHLDGWERQPQASLLIDAPMPRVVPCANSIVQMGRRGGLEEGGASLPYQKINSESFFAH